MVERLQLITGFRASSEPVAEFIARILNARDCVRELRQRTIAAGYDRSGKMVDPVLI